MKVSPLRDICVSWLQYSSQNNLPPPLPVSWISMDPAQFRIAIKCHLWVIRRHIPSNHRQNGDCSSFMTWYSILLSNVFLTVNEYFIIIPYSHALLYPCLTIVSFLEVFYVILLIWGKFTIFDRCQQDIANVSATLFMLTVWQQE